ncbi:MAG: peptidoglycan-binding protein [Blastocatellia bacterium]
MSKNGFRQSLVACALIAMLTASLSFAAAAQQHRPRYGVRPTMDGTWNVPEDTVISVRMDSTLSSKSARVGDRFTATVDVPVYVNGATVIPAGATIEGHVTQVTPARRLARSGTIAVEFENLVLPDGMRVAIDGGLTSDDPEVRRQIDEENRVSGRKNRDTGVFVGSSGAVGAVLGGIAGGLKGAAVGGAIGAGVAIGSILFSKGEEAKVQSGTPFGVQLRRALVIHTGQASDQVATRGQDDNRYPNRRDPVATDDRYRRQPTDTQPDYPPAEDRQPVEDGSARQPSEVEPDNDPAEAPASRQPAEPPAARQPIGTRSSDPAPEREENNSTVAESTSAPAEPLPLGAPEMTRRAQTALRYEGYYEGEITDQWSPRATESLKAYQREHKLSETGNLDEATAKSLGLNNVGPVSATRPAANPVSNRPETRPSAQGSVLANVLSATATRNGDGTVYVLINVQANTGGWRWFGEHVVNGDTLEVYARAIRPTGMVTQALTRGKIELNVRDGVGNVTRVVLHSAGADQVIALSRSAANANPTPAPVRTAPDDSLSTLAKGIQSRAGDLLAEHKRQLGMSGERRGDADRSVYNDADVELLFALNSFANAANLYAGLIGNLRDSQSKRQATLDLARQARRTDRIIAVSTSRTAGALLPQWDIIRQDVLRLMRMFNINTSEIEN